MILSETETLIWDWNRTLLDDVELNVKVINEMLSKRDLPLLDINTYKEIFCFPVKQFHIRIGIDFEKESIEEISAEYMERYKNYEKDIKLHVDVPFIRSMQKASANIFYLLPEQTIYCACLTVST